MVHSVPDDKVDKSSAPTYYSPKMASGRKRRPIERLLDRIEKEANEENWSRDRRLAEQVLGFAPDNSDARAFLTVVQEGLFAGLDHQIEASQVTAPCLTADKQIIKEGSCRR